MTAPELSAEERAIVDRFEAATEPVEITLERVKADANAWAWGGTDLTPRAEVGGGLREFAEWVVSLDDDDPASPGRQARRTVTLNQIVERARTALDADR